MRAFFLLFFSTSLTLLQGQVRETWNIEGLEREALIFLPSKPSETGAPVVFGFHGHGGNAGNVVRSFRFQKEWPEALVIYMQDVPTPGRLTDPEGKRNGWQSEAGILGDRDLKFFDAVLAWAEEKQDLDTTRVYASGHSNGGGFTYLLWAERPQGFAAVAPKPVMHLASETDPVVKYQWQAAMLEVVKVINGCAQSGMKWDKGCTLYPSETGTPLVVFLHSGGHKCPQAGPPLLVRFFKEHALREAP